MKMTGITRDLPRATPGSRGTDPAILLAMLDEIKCHDLELHSLLVWQDGALITSAYWAPYSANRPHMMHSVTKSFTSMAVGLAVSDGLLSVDDDVLQFFPDYAGPVDANLRMMKVRHLLTMTSGHGRGISGGSWRRVLSSWVEDFLRQPTPYRPGEVFVYDSAASYMLSAIVQQVTGRMIADYLSERIFRPMGMSGSMRWDTGTDGVNTGGNGLSCTSEDMLKLGILHLQGGEWQGRQLLPRPWVKAATGMQIRDVVLGVFTGDHYLGPNELIDGHTVSRREGYGYQWWRGPHDSFSANGLFGQYCIVLPQENAVVAFTGGLEDSDRRVHRLIYDVLRPALGKGAGTLESQGKLEARLAGLRLERLMDSHFSSERVPCGTWIMEPNDQGVESISLVAGDHELSIILRDAEGDHALRVGCGLYIETVTTMPGARLHHSYQPAEGLRVLASARLLKNDAAATVLEMDWIFVETAFRDTVRMRFADGSMTFARQVNVNSSELEWPDMTGRLLTQAVRNKQHG
ncbi:serine hydrolase [Rhizobium sp. SSA_523]|uniref:serine hydrolase domain-containing protein n=1 Tax=Rhizobium sp. SSA_523 TaxID=2952477 RepID=UPI002091A3E3|nr:serine hydrolase [Rhizobium sp. SSA_523]MCO5731579.1 beta-lactamase family protein [Rhizobium sp. SSA_523]WKC21906.1 serine hydrolase [Rhizobium sp. SSA_523]